MGANFKKLDDQIYALFSTAWYIKFWNLEVQTLV